MRKINGNLEKVSAFLQAISPEARLEILLAIGSGEACVCHLEGMLGLRQASISQHLMALREAGVVMDRREGRYVYYRLKDPALLDLVYKAAQYHGFALPAPVSASNCECPNCSERKTI